MTKKINKKNNEQKDLSQPGLTREPCDHEHMIRITL
jgi:hypothetical protein